MMETKRCPYCGEEILVVARTCEFCGERLPEETADSVLREKKMIACPVCGEQIGADEAICPYCHENVEGGDADAGEPEVELRQPDAEPPQTLRPQPAFWTVIRSAFQPAPKSQSGPPLEETKGFFKYYFVDVFFKHFADFSGKIGRKQFWLGFLCLGLFYIFFFALQMLVYLYFLNNELALARLAGLVFVVLLTLLFPTLASIVRRLHDTGRSGNWIFVGLVPLVGIIWLIILLCQKGETRAKKVIVAKADAVVWIIGVLLVVSPLFFAVYQDIPEELDGSSQPNVEKTEQVSESNANSSIARVYMETQQSADGKYDYTIHTKEDDYGEEIWLCVKKKSDSKYKEALLVENVMDGLRYVDYTPLSDGTVQVRCLDGQDLYRVVTMRYDATLTDELGSEESEYEEISLQNAMKHNGEGDCRLAFIYCREIVSLESNPVAQGMIGRYYLIGKGVEQNLEEGIKWTRKAAEQGQPVAQSNLGYCYLEGMGVRKDKAQARHWLKLAADQGHKGAQELLKEL